MKKYPLLNSQLGVLYHCLKYPESTLYNLPSVISLPQSIDIERLERALYMLVESCPTLRLKFILDAQGEPRQYVAHDMDISVSYLNMNDEQFRSYIRSEFIKPFDVFKGMPLVRFVIAKTEKSAYLAIDIHHIICDGISYGKILLGQLLPLAYEGKPLPMQSFEMWNAAEEEMIDCNEKNDSADFMKNKFAGHNFVSLSHKGAKISGRQISASSLINKTDVDDWCASMNISVNVLFMAAFSLVLSRITRLHEVCFHTMVHGRTDRRLRNALGMFVTTLPIFADIRNDMSVKDLFGSLKNEFISALRHSDYSFSKLCVEMNMSPGIYYNFLGAENVEKILLDGIEINGHQLSRPCVEDDLGVEIYTDDIYYDVRCVSSDAINTETSIKRISSCIRHVVLEMMDATDKQLEDISLVDIDEAQKIIDDSYGKHMDENPSSTFPSQFIRQSQLTPYSIAVVDDSGSYTYNELDKVSNIIADYLLTSREKYVSNVCVMLDYQREFMAAVLGIMKAGACYVPIDSNTPSSRLQFIVDDSGCEYIITSHLKNEVLSKTSFAQTIKIIFIEDLINDAYEKGFNDGLSIDKSSLDDCAYMIYTSGSSGNPKGVNISHKSLAHLIKFIVSHWLIHTNSRISCHSNFAFDASVEDLFPVLTVGGSLYIIPENIRKDISLLHDYIIDNKITGGCYSTQFGQLLLKQYPDLPLEYVVVGGEKMTTVPNCSARLINTYGPTEFTVDAVFHELLKSHVYNEIPIGRPIDDCYAFVLDESNHLLPIGFVGELCLSGVQMAQGYNNLPQLTATHFQEINLAGNTYKIYHTGDLVRYNNKKQLEILGRIDNQVKINGVRIELEEIESVISSYGGIISNIVQLKEKDTNRYLCTYFVADKKIDVDDLKSYLKQYLPSCMIPVAFMQIQSMPLTLNGKIDKSFLPNVEINNNSNITYVEPQNATEKIIADIFSKILCIEKVGADDDFFSLGGTSLNAINVVVDANKYGFDIVYKDVFEYKTPRALASYITTRQSILTNTDLSSYQTINSFLIKNNISSYRVKEITELSDCLIAGVTGFLGIHLLKELIEHTSSHIYCLIRNKNHQSATERFNTYIDIYFGPDFDKANLKKRVTILECDVLNTNEIEAVIRLLPRSLTVFNCVGNVKHFSASNDIKTINTVSVRHLINLCLATDSSLIHISTESVAGIKSSNHLDNENTLTEHDFWIEQNVLYNQYVYSKFIAEKMVLEAISSEGLSAKIMRVGNLFARHKDGQFQINKFENNIYATLNAFIMLGAIPEEMLNTTIDISPVDVTARAVRLLSTTPKDYILFHPFHQNKVMVATIVQWLNMYEKKLDILKTSTFRNLLSKSMSNPNLAIQLRPLIAYQLGQNTPLIRNKCDNSYTNQILSSLNFTWPEIQFDYFDQFMRNDIL